MVLDLDKYLKQGVEIKLNGEIIEVLQPTARTTKEISGIEKSINEKNYLEVKSKIAYIILNNNNSNKEFTMDDIDNIPYKLQDMIVRTVSSMVYKADNDPN